MAPRHVSATFSQRTKFTEEQSVTLGLSRPDSSRFEPGWEDLWRARLLPAGLRRHEDDGAAQTVLLQRAECPTAGEGPRLPLAALLLFRPRSWKHCYPDASRYFLTPSSFHIFRGPFSPPFPLMPPDVWSGAEIFTERPCQARLSLAGEERETQLKGVSTFPELLSM